MVEQFLFVPDTEMVEQSLSVPDTEMYHVSDLILLIETRND
jgi:hypothetical protein